MLWILAAIIFVVVIGIYTAYLNNAFLRCPVCRKLGAWRFDDLGPSIEELDDDGNLVRSTQRQSCRKCGSEVDHVWSDFDRREIRRVHD